MATDLQKEFCSLRDTYIEKQFGRLNEMQRQAVFTTSGPLLILAGAGSGKTTVLVNRIANLIRFGSAHGSSYTPRPAADEDLRALRTAIMTGTDVPAWLDGMMRCEPVRSWNVMAITFTNKAAGELKARLRAMLGDEEGDEVFASTFHSACVRILRRYAEEIGWPRSFTIYDTDDAQRVMKALYKEQNVDDKFYPVKTALNQLGRWKDQLLSPADAAKEAAGKTKLELAARLYGLYEKRLQEAGAFDFDGLIYYTVRLLQENKEARDYYQNRYRYLLVDEYQDTSVAQFKLVSLLTGPEQNICVVGDDDQSIYRFRGATIENILNFERYYPGAKVIRLEQNYRSTSNILNAANCVISHNTERKGKTLWTKNGEGAPVHVYQAEDDREEAAHIAEVIGQHLRAGGKLADHAILYRMNAQSAPIENYFTRAGIPHKIVGGQRFNDRKEVKDIHSYMSIVANPKDDVRLRRIINEPARKIGASTVDAIAELAGQEGVGMMDIISHADEYARLSRAVGPLLKFWQIYQALQEALDTARRSTKEKSAFFSNMSHDMRTPLNAIVGLSELSAQYEDTDRLKDCLRKINNASRQLLNLINDILDMSRMEQGKVMLNNREFDLRECLEECLDAFRFQAQAQQKTFDVGLELNNTHLLGDPARISQILNNLLSNAFKFTPEGGTIRFHVSQIDKGDFAKYKIVVADTGIGMSADFLPHLFEPYSREMRFTAKQSVGTGLGMSITKNLVSQMNGELQVESEQGKGTTFTLRIPQRRPRREQDR